MENDFNFGHLLTITRFKTLMEYVIENAKDIDKRYYKQVAVSSAMSLILTPACLLEDLLYFRKETKEPVKEPLFVMGHWRCGTTLLQNIISKDKRYGFVTPRMTYTLNFYHVLGWAFVPRMKDLLKESRKMDNMEYEIDLPFEEYVIFSTMESHGVYPVNFFPKAFKRYAGNAYVKNLSEKQRKRWIKNYDNLLRKVTYLSGGKKLVLKSPDATCRTALLKELYPDAKFVNIYRDPYAVIRSTINLYKVMFEMWAIEDLPDEEEFEDITIEIFKKMYETFFEEIKTLPEGSFYEIKFEDFEKDALPFMEEMYEKLDLGDYEQARGAIEEYWKSLEGYQKNVFDYPERLMKKINENLGFYFEHYGYEMKEI